jgi:uncharacterized membrane protein
MEKQNRWRSKYVWVALTSQVLSILVLTGVLDVSQSEIATQVIALLLQIGTVIGIINNPTDGENW